MSGFDILFDRRVDWESLRTAIAAALEMPQSRVAIVKDVEHYPDDADCVCLMENAEGQFAIHAAIGLLGCELLRVSRPTRDSPCGPSAVHLPDLG